MAIYHFDVSTGTRKGGQSAAAKSDYINRTGAYERVGDKLLHAESGNMPSWSADQPRLYWEAADKHERENGRLFKEFEASLLNELTLEQNRALMHRFIAEVVNTKDGPLPYSAAIHAGVDDGKPYKRKRKFKDAEKVKNPHFHLTVSERVNDGIARGPELWFKRVATGKNSHPSLGGARKTDALKPKEVLEHLRMRWAELANEALAAAGHSARIDHRTLKEQRNEALDQGDYDKAIELNRLPKFHVPIKALELEQRTGEKSEYRQRKEEEQQRELLPEIIKFSSLVTRIKIATAELQGVYQELAGTIKAQLASARASVMDMIRELKFSMSPSPFLSPSLVGVAPQSASSTMPPVIAARPADARDTMTVTERIAASKEKLEALKLEAKAVPLSGVKPVSSTPATGAAPPAGPVAKEPAPEKDAQPSASLAAKPTKAPSPAESPDEKTRRLRDEDLEKLHQDIDRLSSKDRGKLTEGGVLRRAIRLSDLDAVDRLVNSMAAPIDKAHIELIEKSDKSQKLLQTITANMSIEELSALKEHAGSASSEFQQTLGAAAKGSIQRQEQLEMQKPPQQRNQAKLAQPKT